MSRSASTEVIEKQPKFYPLDSLILCFVCCLDHVLLNAVRNIHRQLNLRQNCHNIKIERLFCPQYNQGSLSTEKYMVRPKDKTTIVCLIPWILFSKHKILLESNDLKPEQWKCASADFTQVF